MSSVEIGSLHSFQQVVCRMEKIVMGFHTAKSKVTIASALSMNAVVPDKQSQLTNYQPLDVFKTRLAQIVNTGLMAGKQ